MPRRTSIFQGNYGRPKSSVKQYYRTISFEKLLDKSRIHLAKRPIRQIAFVGTARSPDYQMICRILSL